MLSNSISVFSLHIFSGWGWARSGKGKWSQLELSGDSLMLKEQSLIFATVNLLRVLF